MKKNCGANYKKKIRVGAGTGASGGILGRSLRENARLKEKDLPLQARCLFWGSWVPASRKLGSLPDLIKKHTTASKKGV